MKWKIVLLALAAPALLIGCEPEEQKPQGTFSNVVVESKAKNRECGRGCWDSYHVTVAKGDEKVQLGTSSEDIFNAMLEGSTVDVTYGEDFRILKIKFPKMEEKVK